MAEFRHSDTGIARSLFVLAEIAERVRAAAGAGAPGNSRGMVPIRFLIRAAYFLAAEFRRFEL